MVACHDYGDGRGCVMKKFMRTIREFMDWIGGLDFDHPDPTVVSLIILVVMGFVCIALLFLLLVVNKSLLALLIMPGIPATIVLLSFIDRDKS